MNIPSCELRQHTSLIRRPLNLVSCRIVTATRSVSNNVIAPPRAPTPKPASPNISFAISMHQKPFSPLSLTVKAPSSRPFTSSPTRSHSLYKSPDAHNHLAPTHSHLSKRILTCRYISQPAIANMSSDDAYASFLDKANQDTGSSSAQASSSSKKQLSTTSSGLSPPAHLKGITATYTSDADEPFEPIALSFSGSSVSVKTFAKAVGAEEGEVEELSVKEWDPNGEYADVVQKVEGVVDGSVKVFRVEGEGARVEYWIVGKGKGKEEGALLGVRAKAVES